MGSLRCQEALNLCNRVPVKLQGIVFPGVLYHFLLRGQHPPVRIISGDNKQDIFSHVFRLFTVTSTSADVPVILQLLIAKDSSSSIWTTQKSELFPIFASPVGIDLELAGIQCHVVRQHLRVGFTGDRAILIPVQHSITV